MREQLLCGMKALFTSGKEPSKTDAALCEFATGPGVGRFIILGLLYKAIWQPADVPPHAVWQETCR